MRGKREDSYSHLPFPNMCKMYKSNIRKMMSWFKVLTYTGVGGVVPCVI